MQLDEGGRREGETGDDIQQLRIFTIDIYCSTKKCFDAKCFDFVRCPRQDPLRAQMWSFVIDIKDSMELL